MVFLSVLLISFFLFLFILVFPKKATTVTVTKDGVIVKTLSISENCEFEIDGNLTVCIENGEVYVKESHCKDKICEKTGKISKQGSSIICLPQKIVISLSGEGDFDALV